MGPRMHRQCTPLDKTLATVFHRAFIWSLVGVYPVVSAQVRLAIENLLQSAWRESSLEYPMMTNENMKGPREGSYLVAVLPSAVKTAFTTIFHGRE